ncbi:LYR motif-containing protein 2 [Microplitis mediator]|uniref:LYR motif-containing protein 2 n=1 Tax=Microplitis mediator TaxID=375433 RepID=UPI002556BEEF|nr:LYR motif-containing protein 2 [Microplitis mediator]
MNIDVSNSINIGKNIDSSIIDVYRASLDSLDTSLTNNYFYILNIASISMLNKISNSSMNLKQFLVRQQVITLYRNILRTIKKIPTKEDQSYFLEWARSEFKANKNITDEFAIKSLIIHGENSMKELEKNLNYSK